MLILITRTKAGDTKGDEIPIPNSPQMPKISISTPTSVEALQAAIGLLRAKERRWRKTGSKRALLIYLKTVYRLYAMWKRKGKLLPATTLVSRLFIGKERSGRHPIRTVI